jgi:hypothetical protein
LKLERMHCRTGEVRLLEMEKGDGTQMEERGKELLNLCGGGVWGSRLAEGKSLRTYLEQKKGNGHIGQRMFGNQLGMEAYYKICAQGRYIL